ncbi:kinesin-like protein KIF20B isoform X1 [Corythoichthys intestinalis]|uniref:kinesin-like protein KIF20B isoform X1 n=1 Tax=Corythoichthys intestinalis TaxID=161448 RepID=UPI0025A600DE|nr:kinesin-like protein KIF20B isoform X1 [Corythoichthys intestinalis]
MTESCQLDPDVMDDLAGLCSEDSSGDSQHILPGGSEEKEHVKVYLRVRPLTATESQIRAGLGICSEGCLSVEPPDTILVRPKSANLGSEKVFAHAAQRFQFSQVYGPDTSQKELFRGTVKELVGHVLHGGNSLVFTYGVTNAGKTFTFLGTDDDAGILPRSLDLIFSSLGEKVSDRPDVKPHRCRELVRLSEEQRAQDAAFKDNLLRRLKSGSDSTLGSDDSKTFFQDSAWLRETAEERLSLGEEAHDKFSVWVSFCEIYNENIHDLLEAAPGGTGRRTALRLSQDAHGNAFVKDLRWVQVDDADEAYRVVKLGKSNQSFSSTKINQLSSRSHSIFSIRILRTKDGESPPEVAISELCLCDLAGSERCDKTQNQGQRLKEAGNINSSLLILGKCINALRHNRNAKAPQHVPFRESKLTHYLQGFLSGGSKVRMLVNVSQCASAIDETLRVLKFSALAQKVVLVPSRAPPAPPNKDPRITQIDQDNGPEEEEGDEEDYGSTKHMMSQSEDEDDFEDDIQDEIISGMTNEQVALVRRLRLELRKERAEKASAEARVREDLGAELGGLVAKMQDDFTERLAREKELLEERAEERLEIFKMLTDKMAACTEDHHQEAEKEAQMAALRQELGEEREEALRESRRREAERRRELLAVAHEAIEQKDAELEKRALQIAQLEDLSKENSDKVKNLTLDLEKKEELCGEFREKLADYKKQIQQVHKEISATKEEDELLRRKIGDAEKLKKKLQADLTSKDRTIQQLKTDQAAETQRNENLRLYHEACRELEANRRLADDMRSTLLEQEETQEQMERALEEKVELIQELRRELEQVKEMSTGRNGEDDVLPDVTVTRREDTVLAQESLKLSEEKHEAERLKWREEKLSLIGQIKEAEQKRNQEVKKFAEDRERYLARQAQLEAELVDKEEKMESWRKERDVLVAGLEVQMRKLLASIAQKDQIIQQLRCNSTQSQPEGSSGDPSLLESSQISTENGHTSRFPQPELEISFSPLRPDRLALRRQGSTEAVTVKITPSTRKRKSADKNEVEVENEKNSKATATLNQGQDKVQSATSPGGASVHSRKEGTLQKIGDFLQSSPTLIGSKAKKMMSLVSGVDLSASSSPAKKSKRKLLAADISSPMDMPAHPMIKNVCEDKQSDYLSIKRRLRSRVGK